MFLFKKRIAGVKHFCVSKKNKIYYAIGIRASEREVYFEGERIMDKTKVYSLTPSDKGVFVNVKNGAYLFDDQKCENTFLGKLFKGELDGREVFEEVRNNVPYLTFEGNCGNDIVESSALLLLCGKRGYKVLFDEDLSMIGLSMFTASGQQWVFKMSELKGEGDIRVRRILGELEGQVWIALNKHIIIALEIETGVLTKHVSSISGFICNWLPSSIPAPEAMEVDAQRACLVGCMWEFYWEVNPVSGEISFFDLTDYFKKEKIRNDKPAYVLGNNHIYFISKDESKIGALNVETKRLDWSHSFEKDANGFVPEIVEIKGNDDLLGALDRNGVLHVFEKKKKLFT